MSLQFNNRKLYLFDAATSRDSDAVDTHLNSDPAVITFQDVAELSITPQATDDAPSRESWSASGTKKPFVQRKAEVEGEIPLTAGVDGTQWPKTSDNTPWYEPILRAMNLTVDSVSAGSTDFKPQTNFLATATLYQFIRNVENSQSRLRYATDCLLSGEISIAVGEEASLSFSGGGYYNESITQQRDYINASGHVVLDKDGTDLTTQTNWGTVTQQLADESPLVPKGMSVTVGGNSYEISEFTLDLGWSQDEIDVVTSAEGKLDHVNTRGGTEAMTGGFTLLRSTAANFDQLITDYEAANEVSIDITLNEVNGSRSIDLSMPKCQLGIEEEGDNGNLMQHDFQFRANRDLGASLAGDNELTLTYNV